MLNQLLNPKGFYVKKTVKLPQRKYEYLTTEFDSFLTENKTSLKNSKRAT